MFKPQQQNCKLLHLIDTNCIFQHILIDCPICCQKQEVIITKKMIKLSCDHMKQCTECRDYNIEKISRCEHCCNKILNEFTSGCSSDCLRNEQTVKASALCLLCGNHLRKEARCCKNSSQLKHIKKKLRKHTVVLVQDSALVLNPRVTDRPCSHYTLCQYCKKSIIKGHRSNTACKECKANVNVVTPNLKRQRNKWSDDFQPVKLPKTASQVTVHQSLDNTTTDSGPWRFGEFCKIPIQALLS